MVRHPAHVPPPARGDQGGMGMPANRTSELSAPDPGHRRARSLRTRRRDMSEPAGRKVTKLLSAKLPHDDTGAALMRFDHIRGQRYTEIFLIGGHAIIHDINAGIYNTIGLNDPDGTGDTTPQAVLDQVDLDALTKQYDVLGAFKNGPRLWTLDWAEVMVGEERDFMGLKARWVMWLDVPKEFRKHESVAYKTITGKRDTQFGIN